ncbi:MAG: hypothetical protein Q4D61_00595 [Cardiobacteriaceae bacterium]|nr:hypothetical protein [Cardiobacteriaceae bacterium]
MKYSAFRRLAALPLCAALVACEPPATRDSALDLCTFIPPGGEAFPLRGAPDAELGHAILRVSDISRGDNQDKREHCGTQFSAKVDDAALIAPIHAALGKDWHYREDIASGNAAIRIHLWQTQSRFWPNRHYALASYQTTLHDVHGQPFRPVYSVHIHDSTRGQHGAVVLGIILSSFLIPVAALLTLWRVRHKKRPRHRE